jgi:hypothetical protein
VEQEERGESVSYSESGDHGQRQRLRGTMDSNESTEETYFASQEDGRGTLKLPEESASELNVFLF